MDDSPLIPPIKDWAYADLILFGHFTDIQAHEILRLRKAIERGIVTDGVGIEENGDA